MIWDYTKSCHSKHMLMHIIKICHGVQLLVVNMCFVLTRINLNSHVLSVTWPTAWNVKYRFIMDNRANNLILTEYLIKTIKNLFNLWKEPNTSNVLVVNSGYQKTKDVIIWLVDASINFVMCAEENIKLVIVWKSLLT